jgi:hypothetical protein
MKFTNQMPIIDQKIIEGDLTLQVDEKILRPLVKDIVDTLDKFTAKDDFYTSIQRVIDIPIDVTNGHYTLIEDRKLYLSASAYSVSLDIVFETLGMVCFDVSELKD